MSRMILFSILFMNLVVSGGYRVFPALAAETAPAPTTESSAMTDIHDIRPPVPMGMAIPIWKILLAILTVILSLAAVWWGWRKFFRKNQEAELLVPELPPEMVAGQALDELEKEREMNGKPFYFRLSAILRRYIEGRYGVGAPEMTTEEFLPHIDPLPMDRTLSQSLKSLCRAMDPVKFGGAVPTKNQMAADLAFVRRFVRETTPSPAAITLDEKTGVPAENRSATSLPPHFPGVKEI